jgi:4'-phosphopantetheinyl transferase EntD
VTAILARLLPTGIAVAEAAGDELSAGELPPLWPEESDGIGPRAVTARRVSYHWGRALARRAMVQLGSAPAAVPKGATREPRWPEGLVGSITHCDDYCAAAVGRAQEWLAVGIDAELVRPLEPGVITRITSEEERAALSLLGDPERAAVALFSAKESVYKVWHPLVGTWLGFHDATVVLDEAAGTFRATLHAAGPLRELDGRFAYHAGMVVTAIAVAAGAGAVAAQGGHG